MRIKPALFAIYFTLFSLVLGLLITQSSVAINAKRANPKIITKVLTSCSTPKQKGITPSPTKARTDNNFFVNFIKICKKFKLWLSYITQQ